MNSDPQSTQFHHGPGIPQAPRGPLAKLFAFVLGAVFLVLALMFSFVALAVVAVGGLLLWGWLRWKMRALRRQMRSTQMNNRQVIEGEFVRHQDAPRNNLPQQ